LIFSSLSLTLSLSLALVCADCGAVPSVVSSDYDETAFFLAVDPATTPAVTQAFGPAQVTTDPPSLVTVWTAGPASLGGTLTASGDPSAPLLLRLRCERVGVATVQVRIPLLGSQPFSPAAFAFRKQCTGTCIHRASCAF
jgi:hypothetical protein